MTKQQAAESVLEKIEHSLDHFKDFTRSAEIMQQHHNTAIIVDHAAQVKNINAWKDSNDIAEQKGAVSPYFEALPKEYLDKLDTFFSTLEESMQADPQATLQAASNLFDATDDAFEQAVDKMVSEGADLEGAEVKSVKNTRALLNQTLQVVSKTAIEQSNKQPKKRGFFGKLRKGLGDFASFTGKITTAITNGKALVAVAKPLVVLGLTTLGVNFFSKSPEANTAKPKTEHSITIDKDNKSQKKLDENVEHLSMVDAMTKQRSGGQSYSLLNRANQRVN